MSDLGSGQVWAEDRWVETISAALGTTWTDKREINQRVHCDGQVEEPRGDPMRHIVMGVLA